MPAKVRYTDLPWWPVWTCTDSPIPDFLAHSNYTELALIELGERDVFPHVGRDTRMRIEGVRNEVYPCITGTFGGVDFLHSVTGEGMFYRPTGTLHIERDVS